MKTCQMEGCTVAVKARGLCARHYQRLLVHGDPNVNLSPRRELSPAERYESSIDRTSTPDGCHLWLLPPGSNGYGRFKSNKVTHYAHRWGYEHLFGPIPEGLVVRHICDVKLCQNPDHWLLGSHADNIRDRDERGLGVWLSGERHGCAKLTAVQVQEIRDRYAAGGVTQTSLAAEFGVTQAAVYKILHRKTWVG
jgi:hypothetical protein